MKFNQLYKQVINEDKSSSKVLSRQGRINLLKKDTEILKNNMREFNVVYGEYLRHEIPLPQVFTVYGNTLKEALEELPDEILQDVFMGVDWDDFENDEYSIIDYLDNVDVGGFSFLGVYENGELIAGFDIDPEAYEDEDGGYIPGFEVYQDFMKKVTGE